MTMTEAKIENAMEAASAYAYLVIARRCADNARMRLKYTDIIADKKLLDVYEVLDKLLIELREVIKEVKE